MTNVVSPISILPSDNFIKKLKRYPRSRIVFVTVKDNSQNGVWTRIGKINDWIRRYSSVYFIVKGTNGGTHFHLIAGIKPNANLVPKKGIHFRIINLSAGVSRLTMDEVADARESRERYDIYKNSVFERLTLEESVECTCIISQIVAMIKKHYQLKRQRSKATTRRLKVSDDIDRIILYLLKNLEEPREDALFRYVDYIERT